MAEEKKDANGQQQVKIVWDTANMQSTYSNACNVAGTREEIVLFFGMNQSFGPGQAELKIQVSNRVLMSPFAAKRLSALLNKAIADYEAKYGKLEG